MRIEKKLEVEAMTVPVKVDVTITPEDALDAFCKAFGFDTEAYGAYTEIKIEQVQIENKLQEVLVKYTEVGEHTEDREIISVDTRIIAIYKAVNELKNAYRAYVQD